MHKLGNYAIAITFAFTFLLATNLLWGFTQKYIEDVIFEALIYSGVITGIVAVRIEKMEKRRRR